MVACLVYIPRTGISSGPLPQQFYPDVKDGIKSPHDCHEMQPIQYKKKCLKPSRFKSLGDYEFHLKKLFALMGDTFIIQKMPAWKNEPEITNGDSQYLAFSVIK